MLSRTDSMRVPVVFVHGSDEDVCGILQGAKADKNLRFLLQKVLKQSDVGSLGRIVLPKVRQTTPFMICIISS
jgi:hypothetical protein